MLTGSRTLTLLSRNTSNQRAWIGPRPIPKKYWERIIQAVPDTAKFLSKLQLRLKRAVENAEYNIYNHYESKNKIRLPHASRNRARHRGHLSRMRDGAYRERKAQNEKRKTQKTR